MVRDCQRWQSLSKVHRDAFERCSDTWQSLASATPNFTLPDEEDRPSSPARFTRRRAAGFALALSLGGVGLLLPWRQERVFLTGVGEQQSVRLRDGTLMTLNTDTRVTTSVETARAAVLKSGEALFEVAKDPIRPFIVHVGDASVVAHGTTFSVRYDPSQRSGQAILEVVLIEGRVSVEGVANGRTTLVPGDRLRGALDAPAGRTSTARVDRPDVRAATAWRQGEIVFDDTSVADAVVEMNRYGHEPIVLHDAVGRMRISGRFRTGDALSFALGVAKLYDLDLRQVDGRLELAQSKP